MLTQITVAPAETGANGAERRVVTRTVDRARMSERAQRIIPSALLVVTLLAFTQLIALWPAALAAAPAVGAPAIVKTTILFGLWTAHFAPEVAVALMVALVGLLGALLSVARRFQKYALHDALTSRDQWSYALIPLQGAILAVVVYFTLRGGFVGVDSTKPLNPYGIAAVAGLVGLFTESAMHKLRAVMRTLLGDTEQPTVGQKSTAADQRTTYVGD